jgi:hypothetical protein
MRKLWASAKQLGLTDQELHEVVAEVASNQSIRALTSEEASRVIDKLVEIGAAPSKSPPPKRRAGRAPLSPHIIELATERQISMISRLLWCLAWGVDDQEFRGCVFQSIGRDNIRTKREASSVINMLRDQIRRRGLEGRVARSHRRQQGGMSGCGGAV